MSEKKKKNKKSKPSVGNVLRDFIIGLGMMGVGFYMLLSKITVSSGFSFSAPIYRYAGYGAQKYGAFGLTSGMVFIPMILGIIWIFYNSKSIWGWMITLTSAAAMIFGVISNLKIRMMTMSSFDLIMILILAFGGLGIFMRSVIKSNEFEED